VNDLNATDRRAKEGPGLLVKLKGFLDRPHSLSLRDNGYDLVRLVLAAMVVYSHSYAVGGYGAEPLARWSKEHLIMGELGVLGLYRLLLLKRRGGGNWLRR